MKSYVGYEYIPSSGYGWKAGKVPQKLVLLFENWWYRPKVDDTNITFAIISPTFQSNQLGHTRERQFEFNDGNNHWLFLDVLMKET